MSDNSNTDIQREGSLSRKSGTSSTLDKSGKKSPNSRGPSALSKNKKSDDLNIENNETNLENNNQNESKVASPMPNVIEEEPQEQEEPLVQDFYFLFFNFNSI